MFVKLETSFKKLLDKNSLRITTYGDSKGLMFFKKFICKTLFLFFFFLKNNFIWVN